VLKTITNKEIYDEHDLFIIDQMTGRTRKRWLGYLAAIEIYAQNNTVLKAIGYHSLIIGHSLMINGNNKKYILIRDAKKIGYNFLILFVGSIANSTKSIFYSIKNLFNRTKNVHANNDISCKSDFLLYHSSNKPNVGPPLVELANRLVNKGFTVSLMNTEQVNSIYIDVVSGKVVNIMREFKFYTNPLKLLFIAIRAVLWYMKLYRMALVADMPYICKMQVKYPFSVWYELVISAVRSQVIDKTLDIHNPLIIITNTEASPISAELLLSKKSMHKYKILFSNDVPLNNIFPGLSDEIWVWNERCISEIMNRYTFKKVPLISVIGNSQFDFIEKIDNSQDSGDRLSEITKGKITFLYLSNYISGNFDYLLENKVADILYEVAKLCPDMRFIFKTRPNKGKIEHINCFDKMSKLNNMLFLSGEEYSFYELMNHKDIVYVASFLSSGLYIASGCGKVTLRAVYSEEMDELCKDEYAYIYEKSIPFRSAKDLIGILKIQSNGEKRFMNNTLKDFPYKGKTIDKMEELCTSYYEKISAE